MRKLLNTLFVTSEDAYLALENENVVIYKGEEKAALTVADLLQKFEEVSGGELANDRMLLSE